ncbi:phage protein NinX family protein [Providencia rettgeri]
MNKYTGLSEFEINLKVAHIMLGKDNYDWCPDKKEVYLAGIDGGDFLPRGYFDPCNNPAYAMPIIIENGISMVRVNNTWSARQFNNHCIEINGDNYYRIAMICFLLMKDAENNQ